MTLTKIRGRDGGHPSTGGAGISIQHFFKYFTRFLRSVRHEYDRHPGDFKKKKGIRAPAAKMLAARRQN
jgi:hypothetical protein